METSPPHLERRENPRGNVIPSRGNTDSSGRRKAPCFASAFQEHRCRLGPAAAFEARHRAAFAHRLGSRPRRRRAHLRAAPRFVTSDGPDPCRR
ncbi:Hypothetical protein A7982_05646 [Minicystis rosea]|nr:Hypothetical protein A7982_05646 [Minicystis rosea]